jgi:hypothetical protein
VDTLDFFRLIVPAEGVKFLAEWKVRPSHPRGGVFVQVPCDTHEDMVEKMDSMAARGENLYYACSTFKEVIYKEKNGYKFASGRTQDNCLAVKALWQDLDVGKRETDGKLKSFCYPTQQDALNSVKLFMTKTGFPRPMIVDSGVGFHIYWPFTESIPPAEWKVISGKMRHAFTACNVLFDPARDQDCASILRPVGAVRSSVGKTVSVFREQEPKAAAYYEELLDRYLEAAGIELPAARHDSRFAIEDKDEIGEKPEYPSSFPEKIAKNCAQVDNFMKTGGASEPIWWMNLGLLKHCFDGEEVAHTGSAHHPDYTYAATQEKMDTWTYGPTSCEKFHSADPTTCESCAYYKKVVSPIQLGYDEATVAPTIEIVNLQTSAVVQIKAPHWPSGFEVLNNSINRMVPNIKTNVLTPARVAAPMFYPIERVQLDDGTYGLTISMNVNGSVWRQFDIPTKALADARSLKVALAAYEIMVYDDKLARIFMSDYLENLRKYRSEINTYKQFGWNPDKTGFLIGSELVMNGTHRVVRTSGGASLQKFEGMESIRGTKQEWVEGVNTLYNRPNGEPYQYSICTQLSAPLVSLMDHKEWNGIVLSLTSNRSGMSKTTSAKIGINALCDSSKTTLTDCTPKLIIGRASAMCNLPFLVDEITESIKEPQELSEVAYGLSNGMSRSGMTSEGRERIPLPPFQLPSTWTGNRNLHQWLTQANISPEAAQMRIFEISMEDYPIMDTLLEGSDEHAAHHMLSLKMVGECYGVWRQDYMNFIFANKDMLKDKLRATAGALITTIGGQSAKERFYINHVACTLVAGWIARKIGMIEFDLMALKKWAYRHILRLRATAVANNATIGEQFSQLLSDLHGSIIVTKGFTTLDARSGKTEIPILPIRNVAVARLVLGTKEEPGRLFITIKAVDDWCNKKTISASFFKRELNAAGLLVLNTDPNSTGLDKKMSLNRGVPSHPMGQCRCLEFEFASAQGYLTEHVDAAA